MNASRHYEHAMLHDVLYVPDMGENLLLVSHFVHHGAEGQFKGDIVKSWTRPKTLHALATSTEISTS